MITATYVDHMGSDLSVVNAARVSFGKNHTEMTEGDTRLIKYLAKYKHTSPFGHAFASFHVKAPVFVARQLVKHKFLRWNEISRRYVDDEPEFYVTEWYWSGSLDAFADMCNLRCKSDTQYETRVVADQINEIMLDLFPVSWEALGELS